jgi:hypothetical protein
MTDQQAPPPPEPHWSPETRTWVSLLLFAHLFAVIVAVTSYTRPSLLQERLHEVFAPYLRNLHLTALPVSYPFARYHLTHAGPGDVDFSIEVGVDAAAAEAEIVMLPPEGLQPLVRFRRYQALANAAGTLAAGELGEIQASILPKTIAAAVLRGRGAEGGTVKIVSHGLPEIEDMATLASVAEAARRNVRTVYDAQALVSPAGVELLRRSTTLEVAPVESRPGRATPGRAPKEPTGARP